MNNGEYWQKRFELLEQAAHQQGVQCYADIEKQYRQAQKQLEGQIAAWYQRFASNNGVTLAEAKRMLNAKELAELKWDVNQYIQYGQENAINGTWVKQLENASARFHISRLEALKLQTQQSIEVMFGNQLDSIDSTMRNVYKSGYYHTAYEIQKGVGVGWDFSALDDKKSKALAGNPDIKATLGGSQGGTGYARIAMRGLLDGDAVNYDGQTDITATSTKTFEQGVVAVGRAKAWLEKDFSYDITGGIDFMQNIADQVTPVADSYETPKEGDYVVYVDAFTEYTTYVLGNGSISYEDLGVKVPYEMNRNPEKNGGQDTLYTRQRKVFAPFGISYEKKSQATLSPTNEELKKGENWTLVHSGETTESKRSYINHKAVPIARIISRG